VTITMALKHTQRQHQRCLVWHQLNTSLTDWTVTVLVLCLADSTHYRCASNFGAASILRRV